MIDNLKRNTVVIVDNVDIDNSLAALAACHPHPGLNLKAVIVTGRLASPDREASITEGDQTYSEEVRRRNTRRLKGLLERLGWNIPVFEGLTPPETLVPHHIHINEELLDLHNDEHNTQSDGSFVQALNFLCKLEGTIDLIIGGPLSEAEKIMREPQLKGRLGILTCQLGLFGFGDVTTMAGGGRTFNSAADPDATRAVLAEWPGEVYMVPTDVTKLPPVGFDTPANLRSFGITDELVQLYEIFWKEALLPRGERIYPHDVHPVFLMAQLRKSLDRQLYNWEEVRVEEVSEYGEITASFSPTGPNQPKRFVIKDVAADAFMELLGATAR